jgi:hypothetical protein
MLNHYQTREREFKKKVQKVKREKATTKIQHFLGDKMKKIKREGNPEDTELTKKNNTV